MTNLVIAEHDSQSIKAATLNTISAAQKGVQATTHMASPLLIVNGPIARTISMNGGVNAFGSGNRANATIGRALRLIMLNVGGGWPGGGRLANGSYRVAYGRA